VVSIQKKKKKRGIGQYLEILSKSRGVARLFRPPTRGLKVVGGGSSRISEFRLAGGEGEKWYCTMSRWRRGRKERKEKNCQILCKKEKN
jgi:hypothetical protein